MEPAHRSTLILNLGKDVSLLSTRHEVLRSAGYIVETTSSIARALKSLREGDFDVVVMCHSLSEGERTYLTNCIRETGSTIPVIVVEAGDSRSNHRFRDESSGSAPDELLRKVGAVLRQSSSVDATSSALEDRRTTRT